MHPAQIQAAIRMREYTQAKIAQECGVEPNTVSAVIHSRSRSKQVERRIANVTGLPLSELWPAWHGPADQRRSRRVPVSAMAAAVRIFG
jgi:lambda repressor-like predicted transcriptional regulator